MSDSSGPLIDGLADGGLDQSQQLIQEAIDDALHSLPEGESSGVCDVCGKKIEPARLDLISGTGECASCARKVQGIPILPSSN